MPWSCRVRSGQYGEAGELRAVAIIQARLASSRLPAKTLLPLPTGRSVIQEVVNRALRIEGLDDVVLAVPTSPGCNMLAAAVTGACHTFAIGGDENDLLFRYTKAAQMAHADIVMRITADCPLLNPELASEMLAAFRRSWERASSNGIDYLSNSWPERTFPKGWDIEIFRRDVLEAINTVCESAYEREHVGPAFQNRKLIWNCRNWKANVDQGSWKNLSLDTLEDYVNICKRMKDDASLTGNRQRAAE